MKRLDILLTEQQLVPSRSRARDMIMRGCVAVAGEVVTKPGHLVAGGVDLDITDPARGYVSRAALKLIAGLDVSGFNPAGCLCLDLGASTGGFTQVLLEKKAGHVMAVDVGQGQMAKDMAADPRVTLMEKVNARHLTPDLVPEPPHFIVSDMSFISLTIGAGPALNLAAADARAILLVKPQFEVGREWIGKGGIVAGDAPLEATLDKVRNWFDGLEGWMSDSLAPSPILGGDGNREYLLIGRRNG